MRIAVIGTGYVGLVSGVCFSEFGSSVVCVDTDATKVARLQSGEVPIYEPGLEALMRSNMEAGRLEFTTDLSRALIGAEVAFIAVGTPSRRGDGFADLSYVCQAARDIAHAAVAPLLVVTKSTVPVGTGREIARILQQERPELHFEVASNPEFLREGSAVDDFMRPDRVVVGVRSEQAKDTMRALYRPLNLNETPICFTDVETAEMIKYAANSFLATKIAFINEMSDLCERLGADVQQVSKAMGMDRRIGNKFLHASPGFGGSCFPKDTRALVHMAREAGTPTRIIESVVEANETRKHRMVDKIVAACDGDVAGKKIAILGLTFKPNTDDMREAASLVILPGLIERGATIVAHDPKGMSEAAKHLPKKVTFATDVYSMAEGADAVVLLTEWNEYRKLDLPRLRDTLRTRLFIDLRNVYPPAEVNAAGLSYVSLGRPDAMLESAMAQPKLAKAS